MCVIIIIKKENLYLVRNWTKFYICKNEYYEDNGCVCVGGGGWGCMADIYC